MTRQCPSCGGICKRSVCERANVEVNLMNAEPVARLRFYKGEVVVTKDYETVERNGEFDVYTHPAPAASAESLASVHIKDGCLIGSQRKSGVDIPDGQYALYPIGTFPAPAVDAEPVGYTNEGYKGMQYANAEAYKDIRPDFIERNKLTAPLYKHPAPAVVRQPLTDDEINGLQLPESGTGTIRDLVRVVELAHGIGGSDE